MGCSTLWLASAVSTLSGLVFGYELGIISGALLQLKAEFGLSCVQQEVVVSALLVGALLASLVGGCLIDRYRHRKSMLLSNVLILVGSLFLLSSSYPVLVTGRITVGFGMCISSMSCCILVSELVTAERRGLLVTLYEAGITVGILAAYAMNYALSDTGGGWKVMFGLAIAPTAVQLAFISFLPSGSKELSSHTNFCGSERDLMNTAQSHELDNHSPGRSTRNEDDNIMYLFQRKDNMRTRTIIGLGLVIFQQFTGQPNVLFYASTIFRSVGFQSVTSAVLASVGLGLVKVLATLISMVFADRAGRRPLLIGGCSIMAVCLITIGLLSGRPVLGTNGMCGFDNGGTNATFQPHSALDNRTLFNESLGESAPLGKALVYRLKPIETVNFPRTGPSADMQGAVVNWIILLCMMAVVCAYSFGFGPMTWLVLSEIFPAGVRGRAFAFINGFNWAANLLVTFTFLNVIDGIGLSGAFFLYGTTAAMACLFFYLMLPETKGKSLEEIDRDLRSNRVHSGEECCSVLRRSRRTLSLKYQRVDSQLSNTNRADSTP